MGNPTRNGPIVAGKCRRASQAEPLDLRAVSPPAESIRNLSILVFAITGFIFLVVEGILIYCIVRSRRRAVGDTTEPPQVYGSSPIEIAWTAAPALIVFILTLVTARSLWQIEIHRRAGRAPTITALFVTVIGHQWWWEYHLRITTTAGSSASARPTSSTSPRARRAWRVRSTWP